MNWTLSILMPNENGRIYDVTEIIMMDLAENLLDKVLLWHIDAIGGKFATLMAAKKMIEA